MKKGFRGTGTVERVDFPNKGIAVTDDGDCEKYNSGTEGGICCK